MTEPQRAGDPDGRAPNDGAAAVQHAPASAAQRASAAAWGVLPAIAVAAAVALLIALPLLALLGTALEDGLAELASAVGSAAPAIAATLWTSIAATTLALVIGGGSAMLVERSTVPGRRLLRAAMVLALIVPGYVSAVAWLDTYGPGGLVDDVVGLAAPALVGPLGIVLVLAVEAAPIVYLIVSAGLRGRAEPDLERAARASGADALTAFRTVTLPLLRPVLGGAGAIAFVLSATAFGVPVVLGVPAGFTTMTTRIYRDLAFSSDPDAFVRAIGLAIVLAVAATAVIALADSLLGRLRSERSGVPGGPIGQPGGMSTVPVQPALRGGATRAALRDPATLLAAVLAWGIVVLCVVLPLLGLAAAALARAPGLPPVPASWTLDGFVEALGPHTLRALGNSVLLAGGAAGLVVLLGAALVAVRRFSGGKLVNGALGITFALPGSTLAVAVLLAYGVVLRDTLLIILVAYVAKLWALGYRPVAAGLAAIPEDLARAARVSGADATTVARTIVLPLLRPAIVAGGLIVFMFGLHEVTMSSLLYGPGTATLGVVVLNLQQLGDPGPSASLAIVLTAIVALAAWPILHRSGALERLAW